MDLSPLVAAAAGAAIGIFTGLIPGLHVNTIAATGLLWIHDERLAPLLVAVGITHTFVSILPATYLGTPDEETALTILPTHRMLLAGEAPAAIQISLRASLLALLLAIAFILPYRWLLTEPGRLAPAVEGATPWILVGALFLLLIQQPDPWTLTTMALAGTIGTIAIHIPVTGLLPGAASPLLPLLAGLFGAPGLIASLHRPPPIPPQLHPETPPPAIQRECRNATLAGTLAASLTALLPGVTSSTAAAATRATHRTSDPRPVIAVLSAVNTAHATFALALLWILGNARTGLAIAVQDLAPPTPWSVGPPPPLAGLLATALGAGLLALMVTPRIERHIRPRVHRVPTRALSLTALAAMTTITVLLTGWLGLAIYLVATIVGLLPLAAGIRRVHLSACLLVPILLRYALT